VEIEETFLKRIIKKIMAKTIVFTIVMVKPNKMPTYLKDHLVAGVHYLVATRN